MDYTPVMEEHFRQPRNAGTLVDPDAVGRARSGECGDLLVLYLRLAEGRVAAARFKAYGCAAAIAAGSMLTCLAIGRTLDALRELDDAAVARALGGISERKQHCSVLAGRCIADALAQLAERG